MGSLFGGILEHILNLAEVPKRSIGEFGGFNGEDIGNHFVSLVELAVLDQDPEQLDGEVGVGEPLFRLGSEEFSAFSSDCCE